MADTVSLGPRLLYKASDVAVTSNMSLAHDYSVLFDVMYGNSVVN